ncbi:hypothetical protein J2T17_007142 [Paenibacillus mucilaginosus]|uniref:hypothetical protein n=1 Tax=Paenibacillus mucilaginosus TaxID=61624 RepID=UPI003D2025FD
MKKNIVLSAFILLLLAIGADVYLLFNAKIPFSNILYRNATGAPEILLNGVALFYKGEVEKKDTDLVQFQLSDTGDPLFKDRGIPEGKPKTPPFIYLKGENQKVYLYKYPKPPFSLGH